MARFPAELLKLAPELQEEALGLDEAVEHKSSSAENVPIGRIPHF